MKNKAALVTGSSRGIGRAIAMELAKNGIDIVVNNSKNPQDFRYYFENRDKIKARFADIAVKKAVP